MKYTMIDDPQSKYFVKTIWEMLEECGMESMQRILAEVYQRSYHQCLKSVKHSHVEGKVPKFIKKDGSYCLITV